MVAQRLYDFEYTPSPGEPDPALSPDGSDPHIVGKVEKSCGSWNEMRRRGRIRRRNTQNSMSSSASRIAAGLMPPRRPALASSAGAATLGGLRAIVKDRADRI
jgi:hypothetical protein